MTDADSRFVEFIAEGVAALELPKPKVAENRYMFKVDDRWIELKYESADDRITFVGLLYMRAPDTEIRADLIASFNAYNLFNGGHTMVAIDDSVVYLCQPHRRVTVPPRDLRRHLEQFTARVIDASAWYLTNLTEAEPLLPPPGDIRASANLLHP